MNFFLYRTSNGDNLDPQRRVPAIEQAISNARAHEQALLTVRGGVTSDLTAHDARVAETRQETARGREERRDLVEAIKHLDLGVPHNVGVLPVLSAFLNMPGLVETCAAIQQLEEERQAWTLLRDDHEPRPYRLKPGMRHRVDGRLVMPGETVMLTARGYSAFSDKFQPITEEVSAATV